MAAANPQTRLLDTLQSDIGVSELDGGEQIFLTPYLALACSLLYMMASDGELEAEESSQLQAVLGGDEAVLSYALRYVQSVPVDQFFAAASELLSVKDKWCILTNVCDALLSDGRADQAELALLAQMIQAFGLREAQFEPYFKILALKNDKSVLGRYTGVKDERQPMTPHFALAIALLYMLTADGSIGKQEIGQLEAVIGEFDGLQVAALKYVRSVKLKQFLDEASALLKPAQKIYILTNVCDSMLSDGEVAQLEDKLFLSLLTAFGFTEKTFANYLQVLETKNVKPFDTSEFKNRVKHERVAGSESADGLTFTNELPDAANQGVWVGAASDAAMSQFIARTMEDNIQSVSDDFENQTNVVKVGLNATDGLNLQRLGDGDDADKNRQRVDSADSADNLQKVKTLAPDTNRQSIEVAASARNQQLMDVDALGVNLQVIDADATGLHREALTPEVRAQNIHEVAEAVHHRLDRFEVDHFSFLQIGRAQKFTDSFSLMEDDAFDVNRPLVEASYARLGVDFSSIDMAKYSEAGADTQTQQERQTESLDQTALVIKSESRSQVLALDTLSTADDAPVGVRRFGELNLYRGTAAWRTRARGFGYVQLAVAAFAVVFAAPIDTQKSWRRAAAGPLIMAPNLSDRDKIMDAELSSLQGPAR